MKNRVLSSLLVLAMLLTLFPVSALAAETVQVGMDQIPAEPCISSVEKYSKNASSGYVSSTAATAKCGDLLGTVDQAVYAGLAEEILKIAENGGSTSVVLDVTGLGVNFEILSIAENGAYIGNYGIDVEKIIHALLNDYPYELFWYNVGGNMTYGTEDRLSTGLKPGTKVPLTTLVFTFPVSAAYQDKTAANRQNTVSTAGVTTAKAAKKNADAVIEAALKSSNSLEQRLRHCVKYILDHVSYGDTNSTNNNTWQMIWVFDENPKTNVVCEGYAKAFKYLCEGLGVESYLVSGHILAPEEGSVKSHMWNILVLDGKSYLVDVTNSEEDTVGAGEALFLKAPDAGGSVEKGYDFSKAQKLKFLYNNSTIDLFADTGILTLSSEDYHSTTGADKDHTGNVTTAAPEAVIRGTAATVEISEGAGQEILNQAIRNGSTEVVIAPSFGGKVTSSDVSIPTDIVAGLGSNTKAGLTVKTPVGDVIIPHDGLKSLSGNAGSVKASAEEHAVHVRVEKAGKRVSVKLMVDGKTISNVEGGIVLRIPCENCTPSTVAMLMHDDGTSEVIRKSVALEGTLSIPLSGSAVVMPVDSSKTFKDVDRTQWYYGAVSFASSHLLFSGTSETTFDPNGTMTRGMLAKVLHNMESNPAPDFGGKFPDVPAGAWFEVAVLWAAGEGIVSGYSNGLYGPNDDITREQLAVMLWRYCGSPKSSHSLKHFSDHGQISGYALEAMAWANENGVINGNGGGLLDPRGKASRAQVAQMLKNFLENT